MKRDVNLLPSAAVKIGTLWFKERKKHSIYMTDRYTSNNKCLCIKVFLEEIVIFICVLEL